MGEYPSQWESDVVLADGGTVHVRPIRPDDAPALRAAFTRLSKDAVYFRFHSYKSELSESELEHFTHVDYEDRFALIAELGNDLVAVARYDRLSTDPSTAEVAFTVADAEQGRGIGTILFEHLAAAAQERGIERFVAFVLMENHAMLRVFEAVGLPLERRADGELAVVEIPLELTDRALEAIEDREFRAGARSIARLLGPRSIAVIGAAREAGTIGHEIFRNLISGGFNGPVTPVHPTAPAIASVTAFPSILQVPHDVDLAVIAVPPSAVFDTLRECAQKGVRAAVIITAGFAETSAEGAETELELAEFARLNGMRLVGPNCLGIVNTAPDVQMNATFAPHPPTEGRVGFLSQSGALGIAILDQADQLGLGVSSFLSIGNKADVSGNDVLEYWEDDRATDVVLLYLESFGNPRKFGRIARRVSRKKPIVAVKSGRTGAGTRAATSHTAAMARPETAIDALFRQAGVIRVDTLWQLFDVARVFAHQPLPAGDRVCIVSNGGGPAILAADALESAGLQVRELSADTQAKLREFLLPTASVTNPVDLVAASTPEHYEQTLRIVLADPEVDSVIVGFTPPLVTRTDDVAEAIARAVTDSPRKPVLANFLEAGRTTSLVPTEAGAIPTFLFPEPAAQALAHVTRYARWRDTPLGTEPEFDDVDLAAARDVVHGTLAASPGEAWLPPADGVSLLQHFGIAVAPTRTVTSAEEALDVAKQLHGPYALKAASPELVHKTDAGAVRLDLPNAEAVAGAYVEMHERLGDEMGGGLIQSMAEQGVETIVGVVHDPSFGPLVMFGMGGTTAELLADRSFRILPLTDRDAHELVSSVRGAPLLHGYRGSTPVDVAGLEELLLRVGALADAIPEVREMDLNPVIVGVNAAVAVDVKIRLVPAHLQPGIPVRRLG